MFDFHYASSSLYCLLFAELLVAEGLDNCRLLGKIRFHVAIPLPFPPSLPWMPFGNISPSVKSLLCHSISLYPTPHPPAPPLTILLSPPASLIRCCSAWSTLDGINADFIYLFKPGLVVIFSCGDAALVKYQMVFLQFLICRHWVQMQSWWFQKCPIYSKWEKSEILTVRCNLFTVSLLSASALSLSIFLFQSIVSLFFPWQTAQSKPVTPKI